jgi:hypothetical protein
MCVVAMLQTLARTLLERLAVHEDQNGLRLPVDIKVAMVELSEEINRQNDQHRHKNGNGI